MELLNSITRKRAEFIIKGNTADIAFAFDGSSPPNPGDNTGQFGFVHTTGGVYVSGQIIYDNGVILSVVDSNVARNLTTRQRINGVIKLEPNSFYTNNDGTWILKGSNILERALLTVAGGLVYTPGSGDIVLVTRE